ncbi:MAG: thiosulfohydrolase SoxB, partial [Gammaproteobacteria bacterium]|nr:thiosulfohydrolase SoxB [Gammaproteobacteria bacterium]
DIKLASQVSGIDVILGGHTHDGIPVPVVVKNNGGQTHVTNAGSNGKFLAVLDLQLTATGVSDVRYKLLPVFSNLLRADASMLTHIENMRQPYLDKLNEPLAVAGSLLYRRGNFNGSFDQVICDALREQLDAQVALSPGFRWGTSVLPGQTITMEHVMDQTAITYPETYARNMKGSELKLILEDVADNLFHEDPYRQQGGDMVRVGGLQYTCDPLAGAGARVQDLRLDDGELIEANKDYKVAGWATVGSRAPGPDIWDVVADHLREQKSVSVDKLNTPKLLGVSDNPGIADYQGEFS